MTVQELIYELNKIEDKSKPAYIEYDGFAEHINELQQSGTYLLITHDQS